MIHQIQMGHGSNEKEKKSYLEVSESQLFFPFDSCLFLLIFCVCLLHFVVFPFIPFRNLIFIFKCFLLAN